MYESVPERRMLTSLLPAVALCVLLGACQVDSSRTESQARDVTFEQLLYAEDIRVGDYVDVTCVIVERGVGAYGCVSHRDDLESADDSNSVNLEFKPNPDSMAMTKCIGERTVVSGRIASTSPIAIEVGFADLEVNVRQWRYDSCY